MNHIHAIRLMCSFKTNCIFYCLKYNLHLETLSSTLIKQQQQISTQSITQNESDEKGSVTIYTNI